MSPLRRHHKYPPDPTPWGARPASSASPAEISAGVAEAGTYRRPAGRDRCRSFFSGRQFLEEADAAPLVAQVAVEGVGRRTPVVAGDFNELAPAVPHPLLGGLDEHPPDAMASRRLVDDK